MTLKEYITKEFGIVPDDFQLVRIIELARGSAVENIEQGDKFLCLKNYYMVDRTIAYKKGKIYTSEHFGCLTDEENSEFHHMDIDKEFIEHFKRVEQ